MSFLIAAAVAVICIQMFTPILLSLYEIGIRMQKAGLPIITISLIALPIFAISLGVYAYKQWKENLANERKRQAERESERKIEIAREQADIMNHVDRIDSIASQASTVVGTIPGYLSLSEKSLNEAIERFKRRSSYPFWDCIEKATQNLQKYRNSIERANSLREEYANAVLQYQQVSCSRDDHIIKPFPINRHSVPALRIGSETAVRIDQLCEVAHSDFEFSNIYASWRTNKTLVAGFQNLSDGLHAIREDLKDIDLTLIEGFDSTTSTIVNSTGETLSGINDLRTTIDRQSEKVPSHAQSIRNDDYPSDSTLTKQDAMIRLLRNIQHNREDVPDIGYLMSTRPRQ